MRVDDGAALIHIEYPIALYENKIPFVSLICGGPESYSYELCQGFVEFSGTVLDTEYFIFFPVDSSWLMVMYSEFQNLPLVSYWVAI